MSANARSLKYLLGWLIAGTRGGPTRAKMIEALKESPQNANQLATLLKMDYKTMRHHLEVLEKNRVKEGNIKIIRVPGSLELPLACQRLAAPSTDRSLAQPLF